MATANGNQDTQESQSGDQSIWVALVLISKLPVGGRMHFGLGFGSSRLIHAQGKPESSEAPHNTDLWPFNLSCHVKVQFLLLLQALIASPLVFSLFVSKSSFGFSICFWVLSSVLFPNPRRHVDGVPCETSESKVPCQGPLPHVNIRLHWGLWPWVHNKKHHHLSLLLAWLQICSLPTKALEDIKHRNFTKRLYERTWLDKQGLKFMGGSVTSWLQKLELIACSLLYPPVISDQMVDCGRYSAIALSSRILQHKIRNTVFLWYYNEILNIL